MKLFKPRIIHKFQLMCARCHCPFYFSSAAELTMLVKYIFFDINFFYHLHGTNVLILRAILSICTV